MTQTNPSLVVHRATSQIGGNCIEVRASSGERIILDMGRPLNAPRSARGLIPQTLDASSPVAGVFISHPHQDHYGLLAEAPAHWPVYCGEAAARLMQLTESIFGPAPARDYRTWRPGERVQVGPFRVTPYLTDHSAFDAYMLLIEVDGKRILYSGDFRRHGRKAGLVQGLMDSPPPDLDALLLEGTNLGTDKPTATESDLETDFTSLFRRTAGRVFVGWSAQNIDRTVTLYRACLRAGRTLVVDLYTAEVLDMLASSGRLPQPGWQQIKVVITRAFSRLYKIKGRGDFVDCMAANGISAAALASSPEKWVIMIRPSLIRDFDAKGVRPRAQDAWSFSQWSGYLKEPAGQALKQWFDMAGAEARHIHTSGHASIADLKEFATKMNARLLIPIHGVAWDSEISEFPNVVRLHDGEWLTLGS